MVTYWLKHGGQFVTTHRDKEGLTDREVKSKILNNPTAITVGVNRPMETPDEFRNKIHFAEVFTHYE